TATLHDNVVIKSHVYIDGNTTIGDGTIVYPFASIGTKTQNISFRGEKTFVEIGKGCEIREFVTINSSSGENTFVRVGDSCLIMAYCHIAHNCELGNYVVMSNNATLAGHVIIEDHAIIGGLTPIHQFVRIGTYSMVGGMSRVTHDVPPYTIGAGVPFKFGGLNIIGLKRHGFTLKTRKELSKVFKLMYRSQLHPDEALKRIEGEVELLPEVRHWIQFCRETKRGLMGLQGVMNASEEEFLIVEDEEEEECACAPVNE
ncbi:MAG: acyl-ACP--UDP-N-acetylglucosamine O-acyltransferase, partial [Waddliaceae bacterium]